jgi:hypothetical protein
METTSSTLNPIEKLTQLCAQRTARTDRLHSAVRTLTDALEAAGARPGEINATVDGWTLSYNDVRSNVGVRDCWSFLRTASDYEGCTDLGLAVNHDGYLHGDFNCPVTGPTRAQLIAFGQRAAQFVEAITAQLTHDVAALDAAVEQVDSTTEEVSRV